MNAYKTEVVLEEEGCLSLRDLPFHIGETVEVIVLETAKNGMASNGVERDGAAAHDPENDAMYHIEELIAGLPDGEGTPVDLAENHNRYIHGRVLDG